MAITRVYTNGFENGETSLATNWTGGLGGDPDIIATDSNTGTYCLDATTNEGCYWQFATPSKQWRIGFWHKITALGSGDSPCPFGFGFAAAKMISTTWDGANLVFFTGDPDTASGTIGTVNNSIFNSLNQWYHVGFDVKIDASGWLYMYVDGVNVLAFVGDLTAEGTAIDRYYHRPDWVLATNTMTSRLDDFYVDDATGQGSGSALVNYKYAPIFGTADHLTEFLGSDGNSTDNYALTDDTPLATATYTASSTVNHYDVYEMGSYTIPDDWSVAAIMPSWTGINLDASGTAKLTGVVVTSGGTTDNATAPAMQTSPTVGAVRYTTKPGGGAWDQTAIDELKSGVKVTT